VLVPDRRRGPRLPEKSRPAVLVGELARVEHLERNLSPKSKILREIDRSHPTLAEDADDLETVDGGKVGHGPQGRRILPAILRPTDAARSGNRAVAQVLESRD